MDGFDPRPGTPVFTGDIASAMAASEVMDVMGMDTMGTDMEMMGMGHDVTLAPVMGRPPPGWRASPAAPPSTPTAAT